MPPERIPTSLLPLKNEVLLILMALSREPMHGYALMEHIEADSHVVLQAGALYRTLRNMLDDGLLEEVESSGASAGDARNRRVYRLTRTGRSVGCAELDRLANLVRRGRDFARRTL